MLMFDFHFIHIFTYSYMADNRGKGLGQTTKDLVREHSDTHNESKNTEERLNTLPGEGRRHNSNKRIP